MRDSALESSYVYKLSKCERFKSVFNRIMKFLSDFIFMFFVVITIVMLIYGLYTKKNGNNGYIPLVSAYVIVSPSMVPTINVYDAVISYRPNVHALKKGDIITFLSSDSAFSGKTVTHRILGVTQAEGQPAFITKGDNNTTPDGSNVLGSSVYGKVFFVIPWLGYLQALLTEAYGWLFLIVLPCIVIIGYDVMKLINIINKGKVDVKFKNVEIEADDEIVGSDDYIAPIKNIVNLGKEKLIDEVIGAKKRVVSDTPILENSFVSNKPFIPLFDRIVHKEKVVEKEEVREVTYSNLGVPAFNIVIACHYVRGVLAEEETYESANIELNNVDTNTDIEQEFDLEYDFYNNIREDQNDINTDNNIGQDIEVEYDMYKVDDEEQENIDTDVEQNTNSQDDEYEIDEEDQNNVTTDISEDQDINSQDDEYEIEEDQNNINNDISEEQDINSQDDEYETDEEDQNNINTDVSEEQDNNLQDDEYKTEEDQNNTNTDTNNTFNIIIACNYSRGVINNDLEYKEDNQDIDSEEEKEEEKEIEYIEIL